VVFITNTTEFATIYVDDMVVAPVTVAQGDADKLPDNLLHNGSFESELSRWDFWTDSSSGTASTSKVAGRSGYAGLVLTKGADGWATNVKQQLLTPLAEGDQYRVELQLQGTRGGETVQVCLQVNHDPWNGPCVEVVASKGWKGFSQTLSIDASLDNQYLGALVSLKSEGGVRIDDVSLVRIVP
jgi:carbohydrate binding protein with CBM4/9 domain